MPAGTRESSFHALTPSWMNPYVMNHDELVSICSLSYVHLGSSDLQELSLGYVLNRAHGEQSSR